MNVLAILLIILWVTVLIGICFLAKRLNTIEKNMVEIHNHLVEGLDHFMQEEANHHENLVNGIGKCFNEMDMKLDNLSDMLQAAQDSRNAIHMKLDNLQENWADLANGSIQVLTVK